MCCLSVAHDEKVLCLDVLCSQGLEELLRRLKIVLDTTIIDTCSFSEYRVVRTSNVSLNVPQWTPTDRLARMSMWIWTASSGLTCWPFMNQRGSYAPIGIDARSNGPYLH